MLPYIDEMPYALAAADLVISRSGSGVSETLACGLPSILVPYPYAASNHQEYNARSLEQAGAAIMILDKDLNGQILAKSIIGILFDQEKYRPNDQCLQDLWPGRMRQGSLPKNINKNGGKVMFGKIKKIHFVGIGGIGMSGIAEVLLNLGYQVSGSDLKFSEVTEHLQKLGATIVEGHRAENVGRAEVVVTSSAVHDDNPEVRAAHEKKIPVIRRAEMLAELMRLKVGIGIAGTHGKTSTTSMIGQVLTHAGLDPTLVIGGKVRYLGSNAKLGTGQYLVAEADEFDRSFLKLAPVIAVITTIEAEHLDCYKDLDEIKNAFVEFANKVPFYGAIIVCLDERGVQAIMPRLEKRCITYGLSSQAELQARDLKFDGMKTSFEVHNGRGLLGDP